MRDGIRRNGWWQLVAGVGMLLMAYGCKVEQFPPELWNVSPNRFDIGRPVELKGAQFGSNPIVTFGRAETAVQATVRSRSDGTLVVEVPRMATGPTQIQVANSEGVTPPVNFTVIQPEPTFDQTNAVLPTNAAPGATIRISGNNLDRLQSVRFDTTSAASFTVVSPNVVLVTISPQQPRGLARMTLLTEGGPIAIPYLIAGTPEITGFSPKRVRAGQEIVVQGRYLTDGVLLINRAAPDPATVRITDTEIRAIVPADATSGRISVTVFEQLIGLSADSIYIAGAPVLTTNPDPMEGITGDKVLLTGLNLGDITSVSFGGTAAPFRILSSTQIEATVPARSQSGNVVISLNGAGGAVSAAQPFLYILPPANLVFTPLRRGINKLVSVTGQNLHRIQQITLNGKLLTINARTEGTGFQFFVPADATTGPITATNRAGTTTSVRSLTVVQAPVVTDYPLRLPAGGRMVIKGNWLRDAVVQFTGAVNPASNDGRNDDTEIWIRVPDDAQPGQFRLTTDSPTAFTSNLFTPIRPVSGVVFTPTKGRVGDELTVTGHFLEDVTDVRFGGGASLAASFQRLGNGEMKVIVPANAVDGTICFTNPAGLACTATVFDVQRVVAGVNFTPKTGKVGTDVTFTGQNLNDVVEVRFGGGLSTPARFRLVGNTLVATVPNDAVSGTICLTTDSGTVCTTDSFVVTK
ncbi:IPT/TIG domain-containing protein [Fibrella aquatica]|uniref:IPT/TIG domain-containing protein n=1 Tax=Fibrella aquatica TaxID=3242487 RepID=UPI0035211457